MGNKRPVLGSAAGEAGLAQFSGKCVLVTGATTGIGFAAAKAFLAEGGQVAITGQNAGRLDDAAGALPGAVPILADAGSVADAEMIARVIEDRFGRLDVMFLNAGIAPRSTLAQITEAKFDEMFAVNVKGIVFPVQKLEHLLPVGASIIVTTSMNNRVGMEKTHLYSASKAAARSLVRTLANELSDRRIRVNAISPGPVATAMATKVDMSEEEVRALGARIMPRIPLARVAEADEIAKIALFLASDAASYMTGAELMADGGWTDVAP